MGHPPVLPEAIPWAEQTVAWWESIRSTPEVSGWTPAQWQFLLDTALVHSDVWCGNLDRLPELRARLVEAGLTPSASREVAKSESKGGGTPLDQLAARRANRGANTARSRRTQA